MRQDLWREKITPDEFQSMRDVSKTWSQAQNGRELKSHLPKQQLIAKGSFEF